MVLIRKILEFDIELAEGATAGISKRSWSHFRAQVESQLNKINASVWNGMSKQDIAQAISKVIYILTVAACKAGVDDLVRDCLRKEYRKSPGM